MKFDPTKISFGLPYETEDGTLYNLDVYYDGKPVHTLQDPVSTEDISDWAESVQPSITGWYGHIAGQLGLEL